MAGEDADVTSTIVHFRYMCMYSTHKHLHTLLKKTELHSVYVIHRNENMHMTLTNILKTLLCVLPSAQRALSTVSAYKMGLNPTQSSIYNHVVCITQSFTYTCILYL